MREYSPTLGRFIQVDPIRFAAGDVNLYRYVGNRVTGRTDPSGLADDLATVFGLRTFQGIPEIFGWIECRKGKPHIVVNDRVGQNEFGNCWKWVRPCVQKHEQTHMDQIQRLGVNPCEGKDMDRKRVTANPNFSAKLEVEAYDSEYQCLQNTLDNPIVPDGCKEKIRQHIDSLLEKRKEFQDKANIQLRNFVPSTSDNGPGQRHWPNRGPACFGEPPDGWVYQPYRLEPLTTGEKVLIGGAVVAFATVAFITVAPEVIIIGGAASAIAMPRIMQAMPRIMQAVGR